jgi:hypothetical protein
MPAYFFPAAKTLLRTARFAAGRQQSSGPTGESGRDYTFIDAALTPV